MAKLPADWQTPADTARTEPPEVQALEAIRASGIGAELDRVELDGRVHRFCVTGDKGLKKSGWYKFYGDNLPAGAFGSWRGDICIKWHATPDHALSDMERSEMESRIERARFEYEQELTRRHEAAAQSAAHIWQTTTPADPSHEYLARKKVKPHGLHQTEDGRLVMPIYIGDRITSLQYIDGKGGKEFHSGGEISAGYYLIPAERPEVKTLYVAEGFATGASVAEATGAAVVVALNAGNLLKVAPWLRSKAPAAEIVIVADNDANGVGKDKADRAAALSGARVVMPPETGDANDYAAAGHDLAALLAERRHWLIKGRDFYKRPDPIRWLIKGWLQADALMMAFGESGAGKTFFVLDMALTIAAGLGDWHGLRAKAGPVVYLAGEGHYGLKGRIAAWADRKGRDIDDIYVSDSACDLNTAEGYRKVVDEVRSYNTQPVLIVVDTLNRFLAGDENKADDARTMIDNCGKLMHEFGCSVLIVHHTGVSPDAKNRARGSSAFRGAMDIEILVEACENGIIRVSQTKSKDAEAAVPLEFEKVQVSLPGWYDDDGDQVTSVVLEPAEPSDRPAAKKRSKDAQRGIEAYYLAAQTKGHVNADGTFGGVDLDDWRETFKGLDDTDEPENKMRARFSRAKKQLLEDKEIIPRNARFFLGGDLSEFRETEFVKDLQGRQ